MLARTLRAAACSSVQPAYCLRTACLHSSYILLIFLVLDLKLVNSGGLVGVVCLKKNVKNQLFGADH